MVDYFVKSKNLILIYDYYYKSSIKNFNKAAISIAAFITLLIKMLEL